MMGLKEFLVSAKAGLADLGAHPRIHLVIGNESCDLDSTISAVSYSYFLQATKPGSDTTYLPVLNIPREQFRLRLEILYFLNKHGITADILVFTDDLDLISLTQNEASVLTVTLVDHHELTASEEYLRGFVVEVLDHRPQAGILPESWRPHIERVGSCCTIIARRMLASESFAVDATLAELLLGTILMDTGNLSDTDGVATPADQEIVLKLQSYLPPESTAASIFEGIHNAKSDLSSLRVLEILYKDLKVLKGAHITVAMASATMRLEEMLSRSEFSSDCEEFCSTLPADVLVIITLWRDPSGQPERRLAVFSINRIYRDQITDVLLSSVSPNLELQQISSLSSMEHVSAFIQNNVQVFRKGVLPLIKEFLAGESTSPDENLNASHHLLQEYSDPLFDSVSPGDMSEEEARRHINLAKTYQSDQFRTSQDIYDLAAVGFEPVISPSLSSDSEAGMGDVHGGDGHFVSEKDKDEDDDDDYDEFSGAYVNVQAYSAAYGSLSGAGDGRSNDVPLENKDIFVPQEVSAINSFTEVKFEDQELEGHGFEGDEFEGHEFESYEHEGHEFENVGFESQDESYLAATDHALQSKTTNDLVDDTFGDDDGVSNPVSASNNRDILRQEEHPVASNMDFMSELDLQEQHHPVASNIDLMSELDLQEQHPVASIIDFMSELDLHEQQHPVASNIDLMSELDLHEQQHPVASNIDLMSELDLHEQQHPVASNIDLMSELDLHEQQHPVASNIDLMSELDLHEQQHPVASNIDLMSELDLQEQHPVASNIDFMSELDLQEQQHPVAINMDFMSELDLQEQQHPVAINMDFMSELDLQEQHPVAINMDFMSELDLQEQQHPVAINMDFMSELDLQEQQHPVASNIDLMSELDLQEQHPVASNMDFMSELDLQEQQHPVAINMDFMSELDLQEQHPVASNIDFMSELDLHGQHSNSEKRSNSLGTDSEDVAGEMLETDDNKQDLGVDDLQEYSPFGTLRQDIVDSPVDFSSMPTSNQTSGQGSKLPSYPETPPNSCIEPSNVVMNKETHLPSFNSSEMVRRIQEKKAALSSAHNKGQGLDDAGNVDGLLGTGEGSSGGGGSLISPAVPQNSFIDPVRGFDFQSSSNQLPKLMSSDFLERVSEKRSQFEWSIESLEGSTSGVDVGPNSEEAVQQSALLADGVQHISVNDRQVPYTPQNSYVEEHLDTYARNSLPSLNNAEMVAKIKAKQSAMFGSGNSSRVSRSSHGSDDSGGCASPDVADKSPREASLDSPQAPYTPQNSFRDNLGGLESRNHLPDLNEVAERLSTGNILKHQLGNSGGGSHDEENVNLNINHQSHRRYGRNSSSQSDSQNTMSDVDSLMSVSTDIATPSDNIVATVLASQMRNEIALLSRKDTNDSDVFPALKTEESSSSARDRDSILPKVSPFDLEASEKSVTETNPDRANGVVNNGYTGAKELFSPLDSSKVRSIEDHAIFEVAESIVAQSVAAAVESSKKIMDAGGYIKESRLRWDDVEPVVNDDHLDSRFDSQEDNDTDDKNDTDDDTGDISESLPDNGLDTVVSQNESVVVVSQHSTELVASDSPFSCSPQTTAPTPGEELSVDSQVSPQNTAPTPGEEHYVDSQISSENHIQQNQLPQRLEGDFEMPGPSSAADAASLAGPSPTADAASLAGPSPPADVASLAEQNLADLALNELAFELANELIQRALDDFPFTQEVTSNVSAGDGAGQVEPDRTSLAGFGAQENAAQPPVLDAALLDSESPSVVRQDSSGNNDVTSKIIPTSETDFDPMTSAVPRYIEDILNSSASSIAEIDSHTASGLLESTKKADSSTDSNSLSSSLERNKSKETDLSMTIMENEIVTTFPERKTSADFTALEEEDIIHSFPGRKFSRSEDYPSRRFSREENSSRRSSRMEDLDLEVAIGPEDVETDYLPNMDPLQGNLDIIDSSFRKITDGDREVVEGESFRKISGENLLQDTDRNEDDEQSGGSDDREDDDLIEDSDGLYTGVADTAELGEHSNLTDSDLSEADDEQHVQKDSGKQAEDILNQNGTHAGVSQQGIVATEEVANSRDVSLAAEILAADISTEPYNDLLDDRITENDDSIVEQVHVPKQKKKIRVSFSEDFDEEIGDFNIALSLRSPLKSPPPLPSAEDSGSSSSSAENLSSAVGDEDQIAPLSAAPTQWTPYQQQNKKKEIYHTSAGRISISLGEESEGLPAEVASSLQLTSFTDQIIGQARAQVEEMIQSAKWAISEADDQLVINDNSSSAPILASPEVPQAARDVGVLSVHESNNVSQTYVDPLNFDPSAVKSNPLNEKPVADWPNQDDLSEPVTAETSALTNNQITLSEPKLQLSQLDALTSDPLASLPTHVRNLSSASAGSFQGAVYSEEWQDDDIVEVAAHSGNDSSPDDSLRKKLVPEPSSAEPEEAVTDNDVEMEDDKNEEDEDSDDGDLEWENDTPVKTPARPGIEPTLTGEPIPQEVPRWKRVSVSGSNFDIDMQAVEPYRNVLSHGGYYDEGLSAIIVFYGCNLPSNRNEDYAYIMDHLFHYVIHTLEELVADDYVIIYFHGSTPRRQMPSLGWLKRCYQSIDRRLRKNLKGLFLVHPTLWLRTVVMMTKPFISTKFTSKLRFVRTLEELNALVPLNNVSIPEAIVHFDIHHKHLPTPPESPYHFPSS